MKHTRAPYIRDVYLAYLIQGARRTQEEGYPIIEPWMVAKKPPVDIVQWDKRNTVKDKSQCAVSFYCKDQYFSSLQCNPKKYTKEVREYECVIGMDASPFDNMPSIVQKSQIFDNLAITYYYGRMGIPVIPNVRLGTDCTVNSLEAYPQNTLIAVGSNGFTHALSNRKIFREQIAIIVDKLSPKGIVVYGPASEIVFQAAENAGIPIFQYDAFMTRRYKEREGQIMKGNDSSFSGYNSAFSRDVRVVTSVSTTHEHSVPETSLPNSVNIKYDQKGNKLSERYYDKNGRAYLDIDYTNHGNKRSHPVVPHQHAITWDKGKLNRSAGKEINK